jgi:hypothetical protein
VTFYSQVWSESKLQSSGAPPRRNLRISLSQPKPKALRLTMASATPTPTLVGGTIDNDSLRRQKQEMGEALSRAQRGGSKTAQVNGSTPGISSAPASIRRSMSLATEQADSAMTDVKINGTSNTSQPQDDLKGNVLSTQASAHLPTPVEEVDDSEVIIEPLTNGIAPHSQSHGPANTAFNYLNQSVVPMERRFRDPGRGKQAISHPTAIFALILT